MGLCATFSGSSYTKNEYNHFDHKIDAEYFLIQQFFSKKGSIFQEKPWKTILEAHLTIF